ncbi:flagellar protein FliT|uniref:Flagellar protein FliT n=1 Tax=Brenneria salicis ATCC 15712 = DSM 30166 TaxID=714314 RepID=A0A366I3W0_9GAMM|nr:flagella biosynthesis regulatory protein FliT [Brenneria salicis]NMN91180.1 flagellar protein FliT [Brenneria salicis ATCC 15712 = DSM 30166]RBP62292.1 flagellar protein FliT [Brenneria salicis ATCC 15712 = DSM 30166]RLM30537.1 flagellar biosynthesis protein FliT [Brenneria salicis ATCC 15712 = DSM 30166]
MDNLHQLVKDYQQLQSLSRKILGLASNGLWDELVELEIVYIQTVENLTKYPIPDNIDSVMRLHFREILQEIIDTESKVKELLQKRMDELSTLMKQTVAQQNANIAYNEFATRNWHPDGTNGN